MLRFWVYIDNKVQGPVEIPALRKLPGFTLLTQVCEEGQQNWRMADDFIEIKAYFSAPPRGSSLVPEAQPELPSAEKNQIEMPLPLPGRSPELRSPSSALPQPDVEVLETLEEPSHPVAQGSPSGPRGAKDAPSSDALRIPCATCGYKNPRDVGVCMKCGTPLKGTGSKPGGSPVVALEELVDVPPQPTISPISRKLDSVPGGGEPVIAKPENPMVEIPVTRILVILLSVSLAGCLFFVTRQFWKQHRRHVVKVQKAVGENSGMSTSIPANDRRIPTRRTSTRASQKSALSGPASSLPGLAGGKTRHKAPATDNENNQAVDGDHPADAASYKVLEQAYPLQQRTPAPVDSKYAVKHRGDKALWAGQEDAAIEQVQRYRIYGGQRTIQRNTEVLMQILRDREYNTAFETGKRLYLLNDVDWAATPAEGPQYEVRLTLSGGREADGSPRSPLRFAFDVDLDRQTVEPGGNAAVRANTMRAFFDESRIPPEERRSVAKDTEELVKAAQPEASPLALDTVSKHFAATYSYPALSRVADAYGLTLLNKKLAHETKISEVLPEAHPKASKVKSETGRVASAPVKTNVTSSASGSIQYTMERGEGKERLLTAQTPSRASPGRLWETLTGYDRLTQFVPDMLVSQREGQDGQAVIVHTVSLTRLMFFVFKINLHLRILEHPQQHRLEFERIAGDFEKFSGYVEIVPDATATHSSMNLHLTLAPKGFMPNWVVRDMTQHFLLPVLDAIRSQAEAS